MLRRRQTSHQVAIRSSILSLSASGVSVTAGGRGTGSLWVATFQYQRQPYKCLETVVAKDVKLDTRNWAPVEASQALSDDRLLALALHLEGEVDLDDVSVTAEAAPTSGPAISVRRR